MKWLRRYFWKHRQKISITIISVEEHQCFEDVSVGSTLKVINVPSGKSPFTIELEGITLITGLKITLNPWKMQDFFKFEGR